MSEIPVKILQHKKLFEGWHDLDDYILQVGPTKIPREVFGIGPVVNIIMYNPERDEVLLTEQFRVGAWRGGHNPVMLEFPGGIIDEGENPLAAAKREAHEETGCEILAIEPVMIFNPTPASVNETVNMFIARYDRAVDGSVHGHDEDEHIQTRIFPLDTALEMLAAGSIRHGMAIIGLQWLALHREKIRNKWLGVK